MIHALLLVFIRCLLWSELIILLIDRYLNVGLEGGIVSLMGGINGRNMPGDRSPIENSWLTRG